MNETLHIENYLLANLQPEEKLLMEAKLLLHADLKSNVKWQQHTYELVKYYGRKSLKQEVEAVHTRLFSESRFENFRKKISHIFK